MRSIFSVPAVSRRRSLSVLLTGAALVVSTTAYAQTPAPPAQPAPAQTQPAPAPAPAPATRSFSSDAGMMFNMIKPDKTADFEMVMGRLKEALQKSADPIRKQQAASWKVFKSLEPGPNGNVLYVFIMDPAVPSADYTVSKILAEVFPTEVQDLYKKYSDAYAGGQNIVNLQLIQNFATAGASAPPEN